MLEPIARGRNRRSRIALIASAIVASVALTLTGCSAGSGSAAESSAPSSEAGAYPVTITSALGSVTIDKKPERVAVWGWGAQDVALALGVVPVAMPKMTYGGDAHGVLPWDADAIKKLGGTTPELLTGADSDQVPFEQFVKARPDVILAPLSGLSQKDYDTLSKIAPVVAYPKQIWGTSWQDQTDIVGKALGRQAEATALKQATEDKVAALGAKFPVLKGTSFLYAAANQPGQLNVYKATDTRVMLLNELGLTNSPSLKALDPKADGSFFYQLSYENLSKVDADVLVMYFDKQSAVDAFTSDPLVAAMPTVAGGRFAPIVGESFVMASSAPSVLSIPWMLDRYVPKLAAAAEKVK